MLIAVFGKTRHPVKVLFLRFFLALRPSRNINGSLNKLSGMFEKHEAADYAEAYLSN